MSCISIKMNYEELGTMGESGRKRINSLIEKSSHEVNQGWSDSSFSHLVNSLSSKSRNRRLTSNEREQIEPLFSQIERILSDQRFPIPKP
jgi:hypothetical protein